MMLVRLFVRDVGKLLVPTHKEISYSEFLLEAIDVGDLDALKKLVAEKANLNVKRENGSTALIMATR